MDGVYTWWGWRFNEALGIAAVVALIVTIGISGGSPGVLILIPLAVLPVYCASRGVKLINASAQAKYDAVVDKIVDDAAKRLGSRFHVEHGHVLQYTHVYKPQITTPVNYELVVLFVEDHALGVCEGAHYNFETGFWRAASVMKELYYEHINSVELAQAAFVLTTSSGGGLTYTISAGADSAVRAIREKMHKRRALPPPKPAAVPAPQPMVERLVVERQVVVMRCRYCSQLTAAELSACQSCGAMMGGA